jgi:hypothetical protein
MTSRPVQVRLSRARATIYFAAVTTIVAVCLRLTACGGSATPAPETPTPPPGVAPPITSAVVIFVGVDVVPMDSEIVLIDQTVVVRDRRIVTVDLRSDVVVEENRRTLVGALHRGYVPILLGTDSGIDVVAPGTSLHEELLELTHAGLTPYDALAAGTVVAAAFLGEEDEFGAIREGLRADLLLLDENPLEDVRTASEPVGVMVNGDWYSGDALEALSRQQ